MSIVIYKTLTILLLFQASVTLIMMEAPDSDSDSEDVELKPKVDIDWDYFGRLLEDEELIDKVEKTVVNETEMESLVNVIKQLEDRSMEPEGHEAVTEDQTYAKTTKILKLPRPPETMDGRRVAIYKGRNINEDNETEADSTTESEQNTADTSSLPEGSPAVPVIWPNGENVSPMHAPDRLGGTAALSGLCDVDLNNDYVLPIYEQYKLGHKVKALEDKLIDKLRNNTSLRIQSCYGYIKDPDEHNSNNSIVANFMECRQTNVTSSKGKCRCLEEGNKLSTMHFRPKTDEEETACEHPIDILHRCDRKLWLRDVEGKLDNILISLRQNRSDIKRVTTALKSLTDLAKALKAKYDKRGLEKICFREDFSMYCNRRRYCRCVRSPNFYFVRSKIVDHCVPVNGTICNAIDPHADLCEESTCQPLFPNETLPGGPPSASPSLLPQACGGFDAWINIEDKGYSILLSNYYYVILRLITTCLIPIVIK